MTSRRAGNPDRDMSVRSRGVVMFWRGITLLCILGGCCMAAGAAFVLESILIVFLRSPEPPGTSTILLMSGLLLVTPFMFFSWAWMVLQKGFGWRIRRPWIAAVILAPFLAAAIDFWLLEHRFVFLLSGEGGKEYRVSGWEALFAAAVFASVVLLTYRDHLPRRWNGECRW